jgi:peptidoglycan/LPS O-acetylase OafA/YrhL
LREDASLERDRRLNNFDLLRFVAASMVIGSHSFPLSGSTREPLRDLTGFGTFGTLGVRMFFVISGYLVTQSLLRSSTVLSFAAKRILRILPALIVVVLLAALVVGPLITSLTPSEYFARPQTQRYITHNIAMSPTIYRLPGVFRSNTYGPAVNGSIWTLPYEMALYIVLAVLAIGIKRSRIVVLGLFVCLFLLQLHPIPHPIVIDHLALRRFVKLGLFFFAGSLLYLYRELLPPNKKVAGLLALLFVASFRTQYSLLVSFFTLPYLVIWLAHYRRLNTGWFSRHGDFSYGMYIYAFPVQQLTVQMSGGHIRPFELFAIAFPVTLLLAFLSWHLVESPALSLKRSPRIQESWGSLARAWQGAWPHARDGESPAVEESSEPSVSQVDDLVDVDVKPE